MSIYIRGMEMPKDGCHHMICIYADGTVSTGGREYTAVPISPHGDLIDADELKKESQYGFFPYEDIKILYESDIDDAPTIIPKEEEK